MNWMQSSRIVLASQSPRRKELLKAAGFEFEIKIADIDEEDIPSTIPITLIPAYLAESKAKKVQELMQANRLILAADSLVFKDNTIFSKPRDRQDAIRILSELSHAEHTVITGVCLLDKTSIEVRSVHSQVIFKEITIQEIEYYIDQYTPYDKAGAYGIQDWIGLCKVDKIIGSYTNIMGLPMETVYEMLFKKLNSYKSST